jgi:hypothetical protein
LRLTVQRNFTKLRGGRQLGARPLSAAVVPIVLYNGADEQFSSLISAKNESVLILRVSPKICFRFMPPALKKFRK